MANKELEELSDKLCSNEGFSNREECFIEVAKPFQVIGELHVDDDYNITDVTWF